MGSFGISEGNITGREKNNTHPQITCLTTTPSREELASATSKQGLNREARAALLRVRTGPEYPEEYLRALM